ASRGRCADSVISFDRLVTLSFVKILLRCVFTVYGERVSFRAISLLLNPWQTHPMISCSLLVIWPIFPFCEMFPASWSKVLADPLSIHSFPSLTAVRAFLNRGISVRGESTPCSRYERSVAQNCPVGCGASWKRAMVKVVCHP